MKSLVKARFFSGRMLLAVATMASIPVISCKQGNHHQPPVIDEARFRETLERTNAMLIDAEKLEIDDFIARYGWDMEQTSTGLRYDIYREGTGPKAEQGMVAVVAYQTFLLNGEMIYSSEQDGLKLFRIGQGGVESGLEEGILMLRKGSKARFILPSHLAHGVSGDGMRIPARASVIYELELVDLN